MKCNRCGAELEDGAIFCGSCGAKIEAPAEESAETAPFSEPADDAKAAAENLSVAVPTEPSAPPIQTEPVIQASPRQSEDDGLPVSLGTWICRHLITFIPCVGWLIYIIMLFVWAFDKKYNSTSRNWAKAELIFMAIAVVIAVIIIAIWVSVIAVTGYGYDNTAPNPYFNYFDMY